MRPDLITKLMIAKTARRDHELFGMSTTDPKVRGVQARRRSKLLKWRRGDAERKAGM